MFIKGCGAMNKIIPFLLVTFGVVSTGFAAQNYSYDALPLNSMTPTTKTNLSVNTLKHSIVTVPAGETFRAVFMAPVTSETAYTGQQILLALNTDFYYNGKSVAPVGSSVTGTVINASKAKHGSINGKLTMRFTHIITPDGLDIPVSAVVKTDDNSGVLIGGNPTEEEAHSLTGAPESKTAVSTLTAGGGGLLKSVWDKGSDVSIPVNASVELLLTQPITLNN